ncbi:putative 2OG-Fe(II) oxygenase [Hyphomicrobiales bacterium]|nr:putative 2OG-Fe(II) oxygenase [Hyphomicrobiales bacterium]
MTTEDLKHIVIKLDEIYQSGNYSFLKKECAKFLQSYPDNYEILNCLAVAEKNLGFLDEAILIHEENIRLSPDNHLAYANLANIYRDEGHLQKSLLFYKHSIERNPTIDSYNNLGNAFEALGKYAEAAKCFLYCVEKDPSYQSAQFNLANRYRSSENYEKAIKHYDLAPNISKSNIYALECLYYLEKFEHFEGRFQDIVSDGVSDALTGCLSSHYSYYRGIDDISSFCPNPLDFIFHCNLIEEGVLDTKMIDDIKNSDNRLNLDFKNQNLLKNGQQSAGNVFLLNDSILSNFKNVILEKIIQYKEKFKNSDNSLIADWPIDHGLSGWFIEMESNGSLETHIHKTGWLSGSIYLDIPKKINSNDGNIFFTLDGANYPKPNNLKKDFPKKIFDLKLGDMVMFPSSLFHGTIPFQSKHKRKCFAFDFFDNKKKLT